MNDITKNIKCPNCHRKGGIDIIIRKKTADAQCEYCDYFLQERVPYPKHRVDHENYQYSFKIGSVRPVNSHENDEQTCSQDEREERKN